MTPRARHRRWPALLAAFALLVGAGAVGAWWLCREQPPNPPVVDLTGADPEVAGLVEAARKDVGNNPRSASHWGYLGMVLRAHDYGSEANDCFEQAERLDPRDPRWPYYRGLTLVLTDPEAGIPCLRRAVERTKDEEPAPRFRLVEVLLQQGEWNEAGRVVRDATAAAPGHPRGRLLRARLALAEKDEKGALAALEGCWDDAHARGQAHRLAAEVWQRLGDPVRAAESQAKADRLPPDLPWPDPLVEEVERLVVGFRARLALAASLHEQGRTAESIRALEQLAGDHPREVAVWVALGQRYQQARAAGAAEGAFERACAIDAGSVDGWYGLGVARLERSPREAADAFGEVIRLKPDHARAHYWLGTCLKARGDRAGAREAFRQALRCQPDHELARKALAELGREGE